MKTRQQKQASSFYAPVAGSVMMQPDSALDPPAWSLKTSPISSEEMPARQKAPAPWFPQQRTLPEIHQTARNGQQNPNLFLHFAGTPLVQNSPDGMSKIYARSSGNSGSMNIGFTGGLTLRKNAVAFSPPSFQTVNSHIREGHKVKHFAKVQQTTATDVVHECFYPGPGLHDRPNTKNMAFEISTDMSDLIRQGEQEHLDDAKRAFDLSYGLIADTINQMQKGTFGPANTPDEAHQLALRELEKRLPPELGTNPGNWVKTLDLMLDMTEKRDKQGLHDISYGPPFSKGGKTILPIQPEPTFSVGKVPSSQIVNYPGKTGSSQSPATRP